MKTAGRISAAIEIIAEFERRRTPLKTIIADWARGARYAGAKDRAWISGLCLDVLRRRQSIARQMADDSPRAAVLGVLGIVWGMAIEDIAIAAAEEPHGPGALSPIENEKLSTSPVSSDEHNGEDYPEWMTPHMTRVFGADHRAQLRSFATRADVDLRLNTLRAAPEKSLSALGRVKGEAIPVLATAARIAAPPASEKGAAITIIPAFNKGWVEVQDLGSQIAAAAAGDIKGRQVLDYCAGGGGKTLALSALMENTGQLYAYDNDARRLKPLFARAKRAGVRNLQIRSPAGGERLDDLHGKMDVVFVDAPCSGAGTWRRHPDTKWRLSAHQLERRMAEQDLVLREAAQFVRVGGAMIYVTCSFLIEENEDRLAAFLTERPDFELAATLDRIEASALLTEAGREALAACVTPGGAIRLTPDKIRADGFFVAVLQLANPRSER